MDFKISRQLRKEENMISVKRGMVKEILSEWEESSLVEVEYDGEVHKAMNYRSISGDIKQIGRAHV